MATKHVGSRRGLPRSLSIHHASRALWRVHGEGGIGVLKSWVQDHARGCGLIMDADAVGRSSI